MVGDDGRDDGRDDGHEAVMAVEVVSNVDAGGVFPFWFVGSVESLECLDDQD